MPEGLGEVPGLCRLRGAWGFIESCYKFLNSIK